MENRLDLDSSGKVEFFCLRFGPLIPLLQHFGETGRVELNELLKLIEVTEKSLESFVKSDEGERRRGRGEESAVMICGEFLLDQNVQTELEFGLLLKIEGIHFLELALHSEKKGSLIVLEYLFDILRRAGSDGSRQRFYDLEKVSVR